MRGLKMAWERARKENYLGFFVLVCRFMLDEGSCVHGQELTWYNLLLAPKEGVTGITY